MSIDIVVPVPPGEFIEDELEARSWSQQDLADIIRRPPRLVSELVNGKRGITVETARGLARAFGTSVELWLNLQRDYEIALSQPRDPNAAAEEVAVERRARLFSLLPIRDMVRRGWIVETKDIGALEADVCRFAACNDASDLDRCMPHAARKSGPDDLSPQQRAWLLRARQLAQIPVPGRFTPTSAAEALKELRGLLPSAEEVRHVPRVLAEHGIRLVIVEGIPGGKIDGACFWLDNLSPVVAMSLRFDRIDNFWFTLAHEIDHIKHNEGQGGVYIVDEDVGVSTDETNNATSTPDTEMERRANVNAAGYLVSPAELSNFIARVQPYFSEDRVRGFARRIGVHPGIVVGQLHNRGMPQANLRKLLEKVRSHLLPSAVVDGWGVTPQVH